MNIGKAKRKFLFFASSALMALLSLNFSQESSSSLYSAENAYTLLSSERNEFPKGRKGNREPWLKFGEFSLCSEYHSLIGIDGNGIAYKEVAA